MHCITYIDESGNTGDDLNSQDQKYFALAAVTLPESAINECSRFFDMIYNQTKELNEPEIKAATWVNSKKKQNALKAILDCLLYHGATMALELIEKRYMISAIIVDNFLDGAYNDTEDYTWVSNLEEKKLAAQYFYDLLTDEQVFQIFDAFRKPTFDGFIQAYQLIVEITTDVRYHSMLLGCKNHLQELYDEEVSIVAESAGKGVGRSPNYTAFAALGGIVAKQCREKGRTTEILFDHCNFVDRPYKKLFEMFSNAKVAPELENITKIVSWKDLILSFSVSNSKSVNLLQSADILATSALKTLQKIFHDSEKSWSDYDDYITNLLSLMLRHDYFNFVMAEEKLQFMLEKFYGKHK